MPLLQEAIKEIQFFRTKGSIDKCTILFSIGLAIGLSACNFDNEIPQNENSLLSAVSKKVTLFVESDRKELKQTSTSFNTVLIAEIYHQLGDSETAVSHYMNLASVDDDAAISKRVTQIAATTSQLKKGLEAAKRWVKLAPRNLEALQYLSLLLLREGEYEASAKQLNQINQLIEEDAEETLQQKSIYSKGLKFIGAMLLIEARHDKALNAFDHYLENYRKQDDKENKIQTVNLGQQYLIRASLAQKAKNYPAVLEAINDYEKNSLDLDNQKLHEVILMKVKALKNLERISEAVSYLKPIIDNKKGSDSLQLELVRMFIIDQQKHKASPYLENLVEKHPDNNDLLKSLIALEIDQKELGKARENIVELKKTSAYNNDATYFLAEVIEAEGDLEKALDKYKKVKSGSLLKNAKRKVKRLTKLLNSPSEKRKVNYKKTIDKVD